MKIYILTGLLLMSFQAQAKMNFKHGVYLSKSLDKITSDISGKHQDFAAFMGNNPNAITEENANIYDGKISDYSSFGYNFKYMPKIGLGYELGVHSTKIKIPKQMALLVHDNDSPFTKKNIQTGSENVEVDSPSSYIRTIDIYIGGLYNFSKIKEDYTPYIGVGYAKINGDWFNSYYRGTPGDDPKYGTKGKTDVSGHYTSFKVGVNFLENYGLELEHAKHKFHANSFRSFNINGSNSSFNRTSLNFIYSF